MVGTMLLNLTIRNWKSFEKETSLVLTPSRERQHRETLSEVPGFRSLKALPVISVYGGNASGKTSLLEALGFLRQLVVKGVAPDMPIPVDPFLLGSASQEDPVVLDVTFLKGETVYQLTVGLTRERVCFESLGQVKDNGGFKELYRRDPSDETPFAIGEGCFDAPDRVRFVFEGTRDNQLFLHNAISQNVDELREAYLWFRDCLVVLGANAGPRPFGAYFMRNGFLDFASHQLHVLDTGIERLEGVDVDYHSIGMPTDIEHQIESMQPDTQLVMIFEKNPGDYDFEVYTATVTDDHPTVRKLRSIHKATGGREVAFDLNRESAGTKRLISLLPMMYDFCSGDEAASCEKVYLVDELDRCLHSMLSKHIIETFLDTCNAKTRKQLIFTTHDLLLMDQSLLRRDEMYIIERDRTGRSQLTGLNEFEGLRYDRDLVRSYLAGRFGGIPMFAGEE
jgi:AAA15 family ATPase/GTPase